MVMQSASGKRGRARSPQKMRAVEFKNKKPTVSNLLTVGLVLRYKKTPLPRRASSFKQKKRVRTRIASRLSLGSVDKKDTRHKRERKAVIKQKPRTRLARRGSRLSKGTTFHTVRRKQKAGKHNMRCSFPLFFCPRIYILYFFAFEMHTPNL